LEESDDFHQICVRARACFLLRLWGAESWKFDLAPTHAFAIPIPQDGLMKMVLPHNDITNYYQAKIDNFLANHGDGSFGAYISSFTIYV
jgi:hypothetical protein